jgi:hypothetical protein
MQVLDVHQFSFSKIYDSISFVCLNSFIQRLQLVVSYCSVFWFMSDFLVNLSLQGLGLFYYTSV